MANMLSLLVTTKKLKPWDVEWLLGNFPYEDIDIAYRALTDTTWSLPSKGGEITITFAGSDYAKSLPSEWVTDMENELSGRLRRAKLASFVVMEYKPGDTADNNAAWLDMVKVSRIAAEYANWPSLTCMVSADRQSLQILRPEKT